MVAVATIIAVAIEVGGGGVVAIDGRCLCRGHSGG